MIEISIIGAGGHTRSSVNILNGYFKSANYKIYDESYVESNNECISGVQVVGKPDEIIIDASVFISVGDNFLRSKYFDKYKKHVIRYNICHKTSFCEENIIFGIANQVYANSYINSYSVLGDNNIVNTSAVIEHEVKIGSHNHISVGAKICGRVEIGNNCFIGAGATVIDGISVCNNVTIAAGAVVVSDVIESGTYIGVPARRIK